MESVTIFAAICIYKLAIWLPVPVAWSGCQLLEFLHEFTEDDEGGRGGGGPGLMGNQGCCLTPCFLFLRDCSIDMGVGNMWTCGREKKEEKCNVS